MRIEDTKTVLIGLFRQCDGNWEKMYKAIKCKEGVEQKNLNWAKKYSNFFVAITDKEYPEVLKYQTNPPMIITKQTADCLKDVGVGVIRVKECGADEDKNEEGDQDHKK